MMKNSVKNNDIYITDDNNNNIFTLINCEKNNIKHANGYFTFIEFHQ